MCVCVCAHVGESPHQGLVKVKKRSTQQLGSTIIGDQIRNLTGTKTTRGETKHLLVKLAQ